jgi:TolB-like protein/predicted Zn-dependent protease
VTDSGRFDTPRRDRLLAFSDKATMKQAPPLRVFCLGHFRIEKDGAPLDAAGRAPRKPLELLKALIALGAENVPEQQLTDALWPDSDGDTARQNFRTTLHRLRTLIGAEALPLTRSSLSLDGSRIWCDCRELVALLTTARQALDRGEPAEAAKAMERALALYSGPFLEGEFEPPEILTARDKLHGRFLAALGDTAKALEVQGQRAEAIRLYQKGAEADPVAEPLTQSLMRALAAEGRAAEAEAAYQRLRRNLEAQGGIAPSKETERVREEIANAAERAKPPETRAAAVFAPSEVSKHNVPEKPSIAVLPLANLSGDPEQEYFSDGITETIITILSKLRNLLVIARSSTFAYKRRVVDVRQVGKELGVRYVLEGSVQRSGRQIRITAQLVSAATGIHVWAESFDRMLDDLFQLQDEITRQIVSAIDVKLVSGEDAIAWQTTTTSAKAYELFLQANDLCARHNQESVARAKALLQEAIKLDPSYAAALTLLGSVYYDEGFERWSDDPGKSFELSGQYHHRALAANPALSEVHTNLAGHYWIVRREYGKALAFAEKAVAMAPSSCAAHMMLGNLRTFIGQADRGIFDLQKALRLSPVPTNELYRHLGETNFVLGRLPEALDYFHKNQDLNPEDKVAWRFLIMVLIELGRPEQAQPYVQALLREMPYFTVQWYEQEFLLFVPDAALRTRMLDDLRLAGVPDG